MLRVELTVGLLDGKMVDLLAERWVDMSVAQMAGRMVVH